MILDSISFSLACAQTFAGYLSLVCIKPLIFHLTMDNFILEKRAQF